MRERRPLRNIFSRRWFRLCFALLIFFTLALLLLPHAVRVGLERWLMNNGADQATVEKVELNLFSGAASLQGVNVVLYGKTVLANSNIYFNLRCT